MKIIFEIKSKKILGDIDEFIDEELPPFQYSLEELRRYVAGEIILVLNNEHQINFDMYPDLIVSFEEVVGSIQRAKSGWIGEDYIWFCEQGRDIYLYYEIDDSSIGLSYTKGDEISKGKGDRPSPKFEVKIKKEDYIKEWEKLFLCICELFSEKLGKIISMPF